MGPASHAGATKEISWCLAAAVLSGASYSPPVNFQLSAWIFKNIFDCKLTLPGNSLYIQRHMSL
jgi:hypothetical protein